MVSMLMAVKEDVEVYEYKLRLNSVMERLIEHAVRERSVHHVLVDRSPNLLSAVHAEGAAVVKDDGVTAIGSTPAEADIRELGIWLAGHEETVFATDRLSELYPAATGFKNTASGLLAARLSRSGTDCMMWFRPEMIETVKWAGDPQKPVEIQTLDQETRLLPRTSFAIWKEEVRRRSAPWSDFEIEAVHGLRQALIEIVVDRAEELGRLNRELAQSNIELDSFAYVAGHDLKEPLRGIHNYSGLLLKSAHDRLTDVERSRLDTVLKLTLRLDDLIESLLQYSRVGRIDMALRPVELNQVVREAMELLHPRIEESGATIQVTELPTVVCDPVRIREVFYNLILNALKYNDREDKRVEVGFLETGGMFFVRDNGIGIEAEHYEDIFRIFKRLHSRDEYGGGTGAGLTIARRVVERHGGKMWVESTPYVGSKFCFTLPATEGVPSEGKR
jgi:light-regulated signal transduction histidine kinase (bacteriophytochrome)